MVFNEFSGFDASKIDQKSMPNRIQKKHGKKASQNRFWPPFLAPQILPKSPKNPKKNEKVAFEKNIQKKSYGNTPASAVPTARQAFWDPAGPSNYHSNN